MAINVKNDIPRGKAKVNVNGGRIIPKRESIAHKFCQIKLEYLNTPNIPMLNNKQTMNIQNLI